ncbi:beta-class carbonic anhydrase [Paenibacillus koleovorans]|uniref:beta-class carbonic anhydrase n=1 Tax=Paenibacillus koleovorans TaxID=121608 RepID=UPI000FD835DA|nr:carbonic anhydrase [Paenibacillus koleovorans]
MSNISDILAFNEHFVTQKDYEEFRTTRFPDKRMVILTCMDTRLVELLPKALNIRNGDAIILKNAGAIVTQPFGNIMRSLIVAIYELTADEVVVIGHYECGMTGLDSERIISKSKDQGISEDVISTLRHSGINLSRWLTGFDDVTQSVENSVDIIRNHPLLPKHIPVHGMLIDPETGKLNWLVNGYEELEKRK